MYQVKYQGGYEIQVIGKGESGPCRVTRTNGDHATVYTGSYAQCERWLADRSLRALDAAAK